MRLMGDSVEFFAAEGMPSTTTSLSSVREVRFERATNRCLVMVSGSPQALMQGDRVLCLRCAILRASRLESLFWHLVYTKGVKSSQQFFRKQVHTF